MLFHRGIVRHRAAHVALGVEGVGLLLAEDDEADAVRLRMRRKPARAWTEPPVCSIPAFGSLAPWNSIVARTVELAFVECGSIFFFDFASYLWWGRAR